MAKRPLMITIICVLFAIIGIVGLAGGIWQIIDTGANPDIVGSVIVSILMLIVIYGLWKGIKVFWYLGLIFSILDIIMAAYTMIESEGINANIVPAVIDVIVICYLATPKVRTYFKI